MSSFEEESRRGYVLVESLQPGDAFSYPDGQLGYWQLEILEERRVSNAFGVPRYEAMVTRNSIKDGDQERYVGILLGTGEVFYIGESQSTSISQYVPANFDEYEALALEVIDENGDLAIRTLHPMSEADSTV